MRIVKTTLFVLLLSFTSTLTAQDAEKSEQAQETEKKAKALEKAEAFYAAEEYSLARAQFQKAFSKAKDRKEKTAITFKIAECYRHLTDCKNAAAQYKRAYKMKYGSEAQLRYAQMIMCQGEYEDAIIEFQAYVTEVPDDPRGQAGIESCKKSLELMNNPTRYLVTNKKELNSKNRDYATAYGGKRKGDYSQLYISSSRPEANSKKESGITGEKFPDIFTADEERKERRRGKKKSAAPQVERKFSTPLPLSETVNTGDGEAAVCFDSRRKSMYFTRCIKEKNNSFGCSIWVTKQIGQDWQTPEKVVLTSDSSKSVGHPNLSPDDQILYFSGDLDGTKGKKDLWMTTFDRRRKAWKEPVNLGNIVNTKGNELFPFAHDDGYLYFASDMHPGFGGLDIHRVKLNEEGMPTGEVENMGYPINTNAQDFAIIWEDGDAAMGYLSSDRAEAGNDDIYSVYLVPLKFTLDGVIASTKDGTPVPMASVKLTGSDGSTTTVTADEKGYYKFEKEALAENTTYKITISKKKFYTNEYDATTIGVPVNAFEFIPSENIFVHGLKLNMQMDPINIPIVLPNVLFDVGKWDLKPESMVALDTVVQILERNPNIVVELRSHTDYTDTKERNQILSQHRADTCVAYLISKGIEQERLVAVGKGEDEPRTIDEEYINRQFYAYDQFEAGTVLSEAWIKRQSGDKQKMANQINRRTDMKVLRDDYEPGVKPGAEAGTGDKKKEEEIVPEFYTCKARDNFAKIAKANGISLVDLKKMNGGLRGVRPFEGLILKVTKGADYSDFDNSHYQVQRGDTYAKISSKTKVSRKELKELNSDIKEKDFKPGMYVKIK
ncbi:MAG: OmpA family protein [Schleiferiaceae bacterium]|jgi:peptidoglycan-associated lipoprotein|nr:OmpA family protein [Schleiferiaceae bacterium]